jgi:hypothetical protein
MLEELATVLGHVALLDLASAKTCAAELLSKERSAPPRKDVEAAHQVR